MSNSQTWRAKRTDFMHRVHARLTSRGKLPTGFTSQPEPRSMGIYARGRQLTAGNFLFAGELTESPNGSIWDIEATTAMAVDELQGFGWLDDLAAVGDFKARDRAQTWVSEWIERYGNGIGPGWVPDLTGRRLIRWINHALFLIRGRDQVWTDKFYRSLAHQTLFLSRRGKTIKPGLARFEAMAGMIYAGLALQGMAKYVDPAVKILAKDCDSQINEQGGIPTRNPLELLEVLTLLHWSVQALTEAERAVPQPIHDAIDRIVPTLRALRHSDGGLARFHGGGRGLEGRLEQAIAASGSKTMPSEKLHMGYARMSAGRTSVVVDASPPPKGAASFEAHASTCTFELTSGRRPVIVNCGNGRSFGEEWRRAGRATASHSTLAVDGYSSSRLGAATRLSGLQREWLIDVPDVVPLEWEELNDGKRLQTAHNGYQKTHGLTHARTLDLAAEGRSLSGEDFIGAISDADKKRFDRAMDAESLQGIAFSIRFHLHPEVDAEIDLGGAAISMALKSGEIWVFRHDGTANLTLEPSVYLENGRLRPRGTLQVVLSGRAMSYANRVRWSLAKAQETPDALRDLAQDVVAGGDSF